jgi:hypothetical protein
MATILDNIPNRWFTSKELLTPPRRPRGKGPTRCSECGATDVGWCHDAGGFWCGKGHYVPKVASAGGSETETLRRSAKPTL